MPSGATVSGMHKSRPTSPRPARTGGRLARSVSAISGAAERRPKTMITLWLVLIAACVVSGSLTGTRMLSQTDSGTGQSAHALRTLNAAGLKAPSIESVLVSSASPARTARAAQAIERRAAALPVVASVLGAGRSPSLSRDHGRIALVRITLRGNPDVADQHAAEVQQAVRRVAAGSAGVRLQETGDGSVGLAITQVVDNNLHRAELISLPITLVILIVAFGALVAAMVPLLLGLTSVAGALGALGLVSQLAPSGSATSSVVLLIGLAVGVDYSLFYIRRGRQERAAGRDQRAALAAATASVGRAIVIAGLTVMIGLAGLLFTGLSVFTSMALGAIVVVAIAMVGSVTVLPAVLALLGDRIDRGRLWPRRRRRPGAAGPSARLGAAVTRRPRAALLAAVVVLVALALPALGMRTADPGENDLPAGSQVLLASRAIDDAFGVSPADADLVVTGSDLHAAAAVAGLHALGRRAASVTGTGETPTVAVARDGRTALVSVTTPQMAPAAANRMVDRLRTTVLPSAGRITPGAHAELTGEAAWNADFTSRLSTATPLVLAFVLGLAFLLLVATFGSPALAAAVIGLDLLSVGAAFGILVAVFQHGLADSLFGFTSDGAIVEWLPLFAFVILFGLSMDYTVLILERAREARVRGADARTAAAEALSSTAATVTGAAAVMIGVFATFATLDVLEFKQLGIGLAAAIAIDATIVRSVGLPAVISLLGGRIKVRARDREPRRQRQQAPEYAALGS